MQSASVRRRLCQSCPSRKSCRAWASASGWYCGRLSYACCQRIYGILTGAFVLVGEAHIKQVQRFRVIRVQAIRLGGQATSTPVCRQARVMVGLIAL